jgi:predicted DNA-binding antitoxin AbrB/MazE fold protein
MTTTVEAIYEHGKLVLPRPLSLPEKSHVRVTIESGDTERES